MKSLIILFSITLSTSVFARQYIQCGDTTSWDGVVINLNDTQSTLFMTNGVHLPDEDRLDFLKDLFYQGNTETHAVFNTEGEVKEVVSVPLEVIGKFSSSFEVIFDHIRQSDGYSYQRVMYCFSAIYKD